MLLTTIAFLLLTGLFIARHLKQRSAAHTGAHNQKASQASSCPRCGASVPAGCDLCPTCGVTQQAFEIVTAETVVESDDAPSRTMHALVRQDVCVGCGTCADACPEPGAITVLNKLATVDIGLCKGHGECVAACPVGAVVLSSGASVTRVTVPQVDANFETNVPGLYVVGELGGRGLIKNAINEGKIAIEHVAKMSGRAPDPASPDDALDVIIVGSGPAGLSAGLEAKRRGLRYRLLEQGSLSDTVQKYPRRKVLLAEPVKVPLYGDLWIADSSKETLLQVWTTIVANTGLEVRTGERVESVRRDGVRFLVESTNGTHVAPRVVLAMGRRGTPRRLGVPGEDSSNVFYDIVEMEAFAGRRVLVIGGGDSAIESALGLANQDGTEVTLAYRGDAFTRIKDRNREKIDRAMADGRVRVRYLAVVREIRPDLVVLDTGGGTSILPTDDVVIRIGGEAPFAFLERLGVRIVQKDLRLPTEAKAG